MLLSKREIIEEVEELPKYEDGTVEEDRHLYVTRASIEDGEFDPDDVMEQDHLKPITEKGSLKAVHVPTNKYTLEQHVDAFKAVLDRLPEETKGKVWNYKTRATMKLFPEETGEGAIGMWVVNSVDSNAAVRVNFFEKRDKTDIHIPKDVLAGNVPGYKRVHRGEWEEEFEDFLGTMSEVRNTWRVIVNDLSDTKAEEEDIEAIKDIVGSKAATKIDEWLKQMRIDEHTGEARKVEPSLWDLILHGIKFVSRRLSDSSRVASDVTKEERLRKLSRSLMAYAL